jgi:uncharacterized protein with GYD domain
MAAFFHLVPMVFRPPGLYRHFMEEAMATFINLVSFTDQGIRNVKESPERFKAFKAMAEKLGLTVKSAYWTMGKYDLVLVVEGSEEAAMTALLKTGSLGNVRTQTMHAFSLDDIAKIIAKMP